VTEPILLVEDNDDTRTALARLLEFRGYSIVEARDGQEALEYFRDGGRACLIVLDIFMPRLDGRAFRAIQMQHPELAGIPVVVFTAGGADDLPDAACVVRKVDPDTLLKMIDRAASGPALTDE
jgi:CheY-like chemotaxis protein